MMYFLRKQSITLIDSFVVGCKVACEKLNRWLVSLSVLVGVASGTSVFGALFAACVVLEIRVHLMDKTTLIVAQRRQYYISSRSAVLHFTPSNSGQNRPTEC